QVGDLAATAGPAAPAPRRLDARQHDLVDVQEAVLVEADVDERGLEPGQDVVDLALVDVADDGPGTAALEVQLGDAPVGRRVGSPPAPAPRLCSRGGAGGLHQRDGGLPPVDAE